MISFKDIPAALRLPGVYIEFDNTLAGQAQIAQKILVIGQRLATGSVAEGVPTRVTSAEQAEAFFGRGSMLAEMLSAMKSTRKMVDTWAIALDENGTGVAATGTITVNTTTAEAGTLAVYIAGKRVLVPVADGEANTVTAAALVAAINADTTLPVTALVNGVTAFQVDLTARWKGETGNDIDLRANYYGDQYPGGVSLAFVAMSGGTQNPDVSTAIAAMGSEWFNWFVMPYTDTANLVALEAELADRWGPLRQIGARAFTAYRGNHAATTTLGDSRNSAHVTCMGTGIAPQPPYIWAAVNAVIGGYNLSIDPARPLQTLTLPGILPPIITDRWTDAERNLLLFDGVATYTVNSDGSVSIERQISMYQENSAGLPDDSYLDITVPETLERIRFRQRAVFAQKYPRHKLAEDDARFGSGQAMMQPKLARGELLTIYRQMEFDGWVQDYEGYAETLVAEIGDGIGGGDRNRLNIQDSPKLVGQYRTHAQQVQFRK